MTTRPAPAKPSPSRMREINETIRYAMWSVFAIETRLGEAGDSRVPPGTRHLLGPFRRVGLGGGRAVEFHRFGDEPGGAVAGAAGQ